MATTANCTTPVRYCLICGDVPVQWGEEPCGAACLECPNCGHSVQPATIEYSTLATPRKPRQTLRRRLHREALDVADEICAMQTSEDWSERRHVAFKAALIVADALNGRNPAELRRLLEV